MWGGDWGGTYCFVPYKKPYNLLVPLQCALFFCSSQKNAMENNVYLLFCLYSSHCILLFFYQLSIHKQKKDTQKDFFLGSSFKVHFFLCAF